MTVEELITEMQEVKTAHEILEISDVLRIFHIQATKDLTEQIMKLRINNGR